MSDRPNYITPAGYAALQAEYHQLFAGERPALVETVSWAAGNGDRSENGDYLYGKKRLREIDRRLGWLSRRMKAAVVVEPAAQPDRSRVWFGATVTIADEDDARRVLTLVGDDETDTTGGRIGWNAPLARALRGSAIGDLRRVELPAGEREYEVVAITYPSDGRNALPAPDVFDGRGDTMTENPRTSAARDNDDSAIIDAAVDDADTGIAGTTSGHNIAHDVGSQNDLTRAVSDPEALTRPQKADDIHHGQARPHARPNDAGRTG